MKLAEQSVSGFADEVASRSPAPGGGSVAALAGAAGASLTAMVCGLTVGKKKYEAVQALVLAGEEQGNAIKTRLLDVMERDTEAFLLVSAAYAMPRETEDQKKTRSDAIQKGLKACTKTPFEMMQLCAEGLELLDRLLGKTNPTAASDFGVAALSYKAAMQGAWLNVQINLRSIQDAAFADEYRQAGAALLAKYLPAADRCAAAMMKACEA